MKRSAYTLFFVILNVLYLIVELAFNARLLDVSAFMSLNTDISQLELYGRSISAAGATLLLWRLLIPYKNKLNLTKSIFKLFIIALVVFPTVFLGQKKLIDTIVDSSSAEMRQSAHLLSVLKYGIANGFVEINQLTVDDITLEKAEGKMFVSLAGLLIYSSQNELNKFNNQSAVIAQYAVTAQQNKDAEVAFRNYQYASLKILEFYQQYIKIVKTHDTQHKLTREKSINYYEQAISEALKPWLLYVQQDTDFIAHYLEKKKELSSLIELLQLATAGCKEDDCMRVNGAGTLSAINQLLGTQSNWQHWCQFDSLTGSMLCLASDAVLNFKLEKIAQKFIAQQNGFDRFYPNRLSYLESHEFYERFAQALEKNDLPLISELDLTDHVLIIDEISLHLKLYNEQQYQQNINDLMGYPVRPKLGVSEFSLLPSMQSYYQRAMEGLYKKPVNISLSRDQFVDQFMQPIYAQKIDYLRNKLAADETWFRTGAPYEAEGKTSLRSLLVPPIAISLSLIFGLLNFASLLLNIIFFIFKENTFKRWVGFIALVALFVLIPRFNDYEIADQTAFVQLADNTEKNLGVMIHLLQWVVRTEPIIYPIGNMLRVNMLEGFEFN